MYGLLETQSNNFQSGAIGAFNAGPMYAALFFNQKRKQESTTSTPTPRPTLRDG